MLRLPTLILLVALVSGCVRAPAPTPAPVPKPGEVVTVRGRLATGAECPEIHARDGRRYALGGSLGSFKTGDEVCVRGRLVEMSICMAGDGTLSIEEIGPAGECP